MVEHVVIKKGEGLTLSLFACRRELTVLGDLLQAQISISEWQFLPAILALQAVDSKLSQWKGLVPLGSQVREFI